MCQLIDNEYQHTFNEYNYEEDFYLAFMAASGKIIENINEFNKIKDEKIKRKICTLKSKNIKHLNDVINISKDEIRTYMMQHKILKIKRLIGDIGLLGLFNCEESNNKSFFIDKFSPSEIEKIKGEKFAIYFYDSEQLILLTKGLSHKIYIPYRGFEIITISPINEGIAPLGIIDKYNGVDAIVSYEFQEDKNFKINLCSDGLVGFYSIKEPEQVLLNGNIVNYIFDEKMKLLTLEVKDTNNPEIVLIY